MTDINIGRLAERHQVSPEAVIALVDAFKRGGTQLAQFNHPELGGMGQYMGGGALMIGDMFNDQLKAKVRALCEDIVKLDWTAGTNSAAASKDQAKSSWWPAGLGTPASVGSQNHSRYAFFPAERRLVIDDGRDVTVYDTGDQVIVGAGQQQSGSYSMSFSTPSGTIDLAKLNRVS
ncbi:MAG: hypothetical protein Q7T86_01810 [Hyphomicrobiaceae bacterium]|nr:hypothetical protein [Hyphomicrobiaceae bacterium]